MKLLTNLHGSPYQAKHNLYQATQLLNDPPSNTKKIVIKNYYLLFEFFNKSIVSSIPLLKLPEKTNPLDLNRSHNTS